MLPATRAPATSSAGHVTGEFIALAMPSPQAVPAAPADIRIELRRGTTSIAVSWPVAAADQCAAWLRGWLR
jgi:transposase